MIAGGDWQLWSPPRDLRSSADNVYGLLPITTAKKISVWLMIIHQVQIGGSCLKLGLRAELYMMRSVAIWIRTLVLFFCLQFIAWSLYVTPLLYMCAALANHDHAWPGAVHSALLANCTAANKALANATMCKDVAKFNVLDQIPQWHVIGWTSHLVGTEGDLLRRQCMHAGGRRPSARTQSPIG